MPLEEYLVPVSPRTNICFDCQNACGACPWSEYDPETKKPRFQPVPGWTAEPVKLNLGTRKAVRIIVDTYHITACPLFLPDEKRKVDFNSLTDKQWAELMKQWRVWGWI